MLNRDKPASARMFLAKVMKRRSHSKPTIAWVLTELGRVYQSRLTQQDFGQIYDIT
ncbi:hypothetical protein WDV93_01555 [Pantoea ananatis]